MTELAPLRTKLALLRRLRRTARWLAGSGSILISGTVGLFALFALDLYFNLSELQRLVMSGLLLLSEVWVIWRWSLPLFARRESELQVALGVESSNRLDSDLVAALQFESGAATTSSSAQLRQLVIRNMLNQRDRVRWFAGNWNHSIWRHAAAQTLALAMILGVSARWPDHVSAFGHRLLLANARYPSATHLQQIRINHTRVFPSSSDGIRVASPASVATGQKVRFAVLARGLLPATGRVEINHPQFPGRQVPLNRVSLDERRRLLEEGLLLLKQRALGDAAEQSGDWRQTLSELLWLDAPALAQHVEQHNPRQEPPQHYAQAIQELLDTWPTEVDGSAAYTGQLDRLPNPGSYVVQLGDDWTEPAALRLLPLPAIRLEVEVTPPNYARDGTADTADTDTRDVEVLAGSNVRLEVSCTNGKTLRMAAVTLTQGTDRQTIDLHSSGGAAPSWKLPDTGTPLSQVTHPWRYEVQVDDTDGLQPATPLRGRIRLRADRPPTGSARVVHDTVLPDAHPVIEYQASDDFGIQSVRMRVDIQRPSTGQPVIPKAVSEGSVRDTPGERHLFPLLKRAPVLASALPLSGRWSLDLPALGVARGDLLKLTLEIVDHRGDFSGERFLDESIVLHVSDERGVLESITKPDIDVEQRLNELIQRQLQTGTCP